MRHVVAPFLGLAVTASAMLANPAPKPIDADALKRAEAVAIQHPYPGYPPEALRLCLSGHGIVAGTVDPKTGRLTSLRMEKSTGHVILDDEVLRTFRQWTFRPGTIRQFRIPVTYTITIPPR